MSFFFSVKWLAASIENVLNVAAKNSLRSLCLGFVFPEFSSESINAILERFKFSIVE